MAEVLGPTLRRRRSRARSRQGVGSDALTRGIATGWLSLMVLVPLAAVVAKSGDNGLGSLIDEVTSARALQALALTVGASFIVVLLNAVLGTIVAWVLVRDTFRGKAFVNALVDLPFALPTIVAGLTLLALYGPSSPLGINVAFTRWAIVLALLFVTLPFVVRSVQPVLHELDPEMEEAAASLGASNSTIVRRVVLPNLLPAIIGGGGLAFARAIGEFGSIVLLSGNLPGKTEVSSVLIFSQIEADNPGAAAANSVVLLLVSVLVLAGFSSLSRRMAKRHG